MDTTSAPRFSQKVVSELLLGGLLESLASCPGVAQVRLFTRAPASALAISSWEGSTATLLPQDLKAFYLVTDGLSLPWSVSFPTFIRRKSLSGTVSSESMELGNIAINPLEHLRLFDIKKDGNQNLKAPGEAYILQDISPHGLVCLMYHSTERQDDLNDSSVYGGSPKTSIYLFAAQDQSWVYLAPDFSSYFRLQLEHLGIKGWQMSRTEAGVPQQTADWLSFYASSSLARPQSIDSDASSLTRLPRTLVSLDKTARLMGLLDRKLTKRS